MLHQKVVGILHFHRNSPVSDRTFQISHKGEKGELIHSETVLGSCIFVDCTHDFTINTLGQRTGVTRADAPGARQGRRSGANVNPSSEAKAEVQNAVHLTTAVRSLVLRMPHNGSQLGLHTCRRYAGGRVEPFDRTLSLLPEANPEARGKRLDRLAVSRAWLGP